MAFQSASSTKTLTIILDNALQGCVSPRTLELFNFLNAPEVNNLGTLFPPIRSYKFWTMEPSPEITSMVPRAEPTPATPFGFLWYVPKLLGKELLEVILRRHLEKYSCFVETSTKLRSFKQSDEEVITVLAKKQDENEILETFTTKWMIGTDGAKGVQKWLRRSDINEIEDSFPGVVRKQLRLMFPGETRDNFHIATGDICLTGASLDRAVGPFFIRSQRS
ncbi:hypothetical protein AZE42_10912 [Rhizopogon vesiculosus]|uniref:FAD-binding domain-containing protein n=1 Tax=Rhizopogon vesiculosus TaxID=180088 RepID=A0A1J8QN04_9AGAM|nr:hypothetical protein AZE42_10912 [Rhizopogon vesiculosus]